MYATKLAFIIISIPYSQVLAAFGWLHLIKDCNGFKNSLAPILSKAVFTRQSTNCFLLDKIRNTKQITPPRQPLW